MMLWDIYIFIYIYIYIYIYIEREREREREREMVNKLAYPFHMVTQFLVLRHLYLKFLLVLICIFSDHIRTLRTIQEVNMASLCQTRVLFTAQHLQSA
jgi:hypothetical protein